MENIIIFGATGTVGVYTALELKEKGYNVIAVGRRLTDNGFFAECNIPYYSVDISRKDDFCKLPQNRIEHILHFAGHMPAKMEGYHPQLYFDSILSGTYNVLEYARRVNAIKVIFTHTRADSNYLMGSKILIPADIEKKYPLIGDHSIYTICKNAVVDLIEHYFYQYGIHRFILRLPTIYAYHPDKYFYVNGKKQIMAFRYIMDRAMDGLPIEIWGDPKREKEIVYVKDFVQIVELAIKCTKYGGVYNVGRGVGVSLEEQIKGIIEVFCHKDKISNIVYRPDKPDARQFIHDITKTVIELGYKPAYDYKRLLVDFKKEMETCRFEKLWGR